MDECGFSGTDIVVSTPSVDPINVRRPSLSVPCYEGEDLHRLGEDSPASVLSERDLGMLSELYKIPIDKLSLPKHYQRPDWAISKKVCFYEVAFKTGLRLPLPSLVKKVLSHFQICPIQLMPNSWRRILAFQVMCEQNGLDEFSDLTFAYTYYPKKHDTDKWRIQFHKRPSQETLMIDIPASNSDWKDRYFFIDESWVFGPDGAGMIPLSWQTNDPEDLHGYSRSEVEEIIGKLKELLFEKRSCRNLLSPRVLVHTTIWETVLKASGVTKQKFVEMCEEAEKVLKAFKAPSMFAEAHPKPSRPKRKKTSEVIPRGPPKAMFGRLSSQSAKIDSLLGESGVSSMRTGSEVGQPHESLVGHRDELSLPKDVLEKVEALLISSNAGAVQDDKRIEDVVSLGFAACQSGAQAIVWMKKRVEVVIREREELSSINDKLNEEVKRLRAAEAKAKKEASTAFKEKKELEEAKAAAENKLGEAKSTVSRVTDGINKVVRKAMAKAGLEIFEKIKEGHDVSEEYLEGEIARCREIVESSEDESEGGDSRLRTSWMWKDDAHSVASE